MNKKIIRISKNGQTEEWTGLKQLCEEHDFPYGTLSKKLNLKNSKHIDENGNLSFLYSGFFFQVGYLNKRVIAESSANSLLSISCGAIQLTDNELKDNSSTIDLNNSLIINEIGTPAIKITKNRKNHLAINYGRFWSVSKKDIESITKILSSSRVVNDEKDEFCRGCSSLLGFDQAYCDKCNIPICDDCSVTDNEHHTGTFCEECNQPPKGGK